MYDDDSPVQFDITIDSVKGSDGSYLSTQDIESYFSKTDNGDSKILKINIPANKLHFTDNTYYIVNVTGTPKSSSISSQKRVAQIQLYGIKQSGQNGISYDLKVSAAAINKQDGELYPRSINVKVAKSDGPNISEIYPNNYEGWTFKYSIDDGDSYSQINSNPVQTEGDNGMLFTATDGTITLSEFVPIIKSSAVAGLSGVSYSIQLSNLQLSYQPQEREYSFSISGDVKLYRIEAGGSSTELSNDSANIEYQLGSGNKTELTYQSGSWHLNIDTTVSSKSQVITLYASNTNGAYLTSMTIPVSASGQKGDKGDAGDASVGQTFSGSPLRIVGAWQSGKKYYDGKRDAQDGIFYQDIVLYENMYYVCINTDSGEEDLWKTTPDVAGYWQNFTVTEDLVTQRIVANQGVIKELSSEEVVIMDGDSIVAGMTSSKQPNSNSDLNGKVEHKGDVRIWAGEIKNADLTTAPFTVTSTGELKSTKANITGQVNATSGSIGNLSITGRMTGDSTGGYLVIDGSSVALYGDDDDWSYGSRIKFYASNSQARGLIAGMTGKTDSLLTISKIGSGLDEHSGYGPCLRLNAEFAFDRVLDINGTVTGLCRDQKIYDFSKTPKPTSFFDDNNSLYIFNNLTQEITVPLVDDFLGREFQIVNLSRYDIKLTKPSSIRMFVSDHGVVPIEVLTLKPYTTVHVIQSYDQISSCLFFYY